MVGEETEGKTDFDLRIGIPLLEKGEEEALRQVEQ